MMMILKMILQMIAVLAVAPLVPGVIGKTKAFFGGRSGPPLFQYYYDLFKLHRKGTVYSPTVTWVFSAAPIVFLGTAVVSSVFVPFGGLSAPASFWGDMVLYAYLFGLGRFFLIIASLDTGSSFEGMGASRDAFFSSLAEITLFMNFALLALLSRQFSLEGMLAINLFTDWRGAGAVLILVVISYFLIMLAENARIPVDDPATHLELTMIHEVMVLDHSGWDYAYILQGSAVKLLVWGSVFLNLLIPFQKLSLQAGLLSFVAGITGLAVAIGIVESVMARLRLNRVPHYLIGAFVLAMMGFVVTLTRS